MPGNRNPTPELVWKADCMFPRRPGVKLSTGATLRGSPAIRVRTALSLFFLLRLFWWPFLSQDVWEYVTACPVCARNKSSNSPPSGLLRPLPVPGRPWSHIALDFIILPPSSGNTVLLIIIDRFSKAAHFVALAKLPTALETTQLLTQHSFRLHGIPQDIVSDRGPQFTVRVEAVLCRAGGPGQSVFWFLSAD